MRKLKGNGKSPLSADELRQRLAAAATALQPERVLVGYVFGAYGRLLRRTGEPGPLSDIDVAVLLDGPGCSSEPTSPSDGTLHLQLLARFVDALGRDDVDLVILNAAPPELRFAVLQDGFPFWRATASAGLDFEMAAIRTYQDMAPYRERWQAERVRRLKSTWPGLASPAQNAASDHPGGQEGNP